MIQVIKRVLRKMLSPEAFLTLSAVRNIHRNYEPHYEQFLRLIPKNGVLLDVGANIGITCAIARRRRPDLNLIAFEPIPLNLKILRRVQTLYSIKRMEVHSVAIGDSEGTVSFAVPRVEGMPATALSHLISEEFQNPEVEQHPFETLSVPMRTLDSFCFDKVDSIKIDVEDHEYHALHGASGLLRKFHPVVFCELWGTANRPRTIEFMRSLGYSVIQYGDIDFLFQPRGSNDAN
jgi:FkbM family methyltransferase